MCSRRLLLVMLGALAIGELAGCSVGFGVGVSIPIGRRKPKPVYVREEGELAWGKATYYSKRYHGRPTASGETHDMYKWTAAHRTLPFGTKVRVRRLDGPDNPAVVVTINDRAVPGGYIIRLSAGAAEEIGLNVTGPAPVALKIIEQAPAVAP